MLSFFQLLKHHLYIIRHTGHQHVISQIQRFTRFPSDDPISHANHPTFSKAPDPKLPYNLYQVWSLIQPPIPKKRGSHFYNDPYRFFFSCRRQAEKKLLKKILRPRDIPVTLQAEIQKLLLDPGHQDPSVPLRTCCTSPGSARLEDRNLRVLRVFVGIPKKMFTAGKMGKLCNF